MRILSLNPHFEGSLLWQRYATSITRLNPDWGTKPLWSRLAWLVRHANENEIVVRLKGGDPGVFGRLEEELDALAVAGIGCDVVPGVTAAMAAAAATQRPLTRRGIGRSVSLTTAMTNDQRQQASRSADTEVFYMAGKQLAALARGLAARGWPANTAVSVVSRAGWPDQLHTDHQLDGLAHAALLHSGRPTVVMVGVGAMPLRATVIGLSAARAWAADNHQGRAATAKP